MRKRQNCRVWFFWRLWWYFPNLVDFFRQNANDFWLLTLVLSKSSCKLAKVWIFRQNSKRRNCWVWFCLAFMLLFWKLCWFMSRKCEWSLIIGWFECWKLAKLWIFSQNAKRDFQLTDIFTRRKCPCSSIFDHWLIWMLKISQIVDF